MQPPPIFWWVFLWLALIKDAVAANLLVGVSLARCEDAAAANFMTGMSVARYGVAAASDFLGVRFSGSLSGRSYRQSSGGCVRGSL